MKTRIWLGGVLAGLLTWTAYGAGQLPEREPTRVPPTAVDPPAVPPPSVPPPPPVPPAPPTMDQLIDTLTEIRAKKAELEKQEQATIAAIQERLRTQRERLNKLGVGEAPGK